MTHGGLVSPKPIKLKLKIVQKRWQKYHILSGSHAIFFWIRPCVEWYILKQINQQKNNDNVTFW